MHRTIQRSVATLAFVIAVVSANVLAQAAGAAIRVKPASGAFIYDKVQNLQLKSALMGREMPYRVILPENYSTAGQAMRYPVVYLLHGLTGHFDNWSDKTKLLEYSRQFGFIIVTPEGNNGWYTDSVSDPKERYESYIVKELIPEIDRVFRTINDRQHRVIAGLSMGGYGSIKFGLKYPEMFSIVGSFSGALGAASFTEQNAGGIGKSIDAIYGPAQSETRKANDVFGLIRALTPDKTAGLPFIYIDCGTEDFLFKSNRDFVELLNEKKVPHEYRELPGAHNWTYWNSQVDEFLRVAARRLASGDQKSKAAAK